MMASCFTLAVKGRELRQGIPAPRRAWDPRMCFLASGPASQWRLTGQQRLAKVTSATLAVLRGVIHLAVGPFQRRLENRRCK